MQTEHTKRRTKWDLILDVLILGLLIIAIARPRWPMEGVRIPAQSRAIVLALDVSGSMAEKDFGVRSRLDAARESFRLFVEGRADEGDSVNLSGRFDDLVGLVTFAARSEMICPPTLSHSVILRVLDEAMPLGQPPDSSTNIGDALVEAINLVQRTAPMGKTIILLSDGEHNVPENVARGALKPVQAARLAEGLGISIHTIHVGPSGGEASDARRSLTTVAEVTGGRSFLAESYNELVEVYRQIEIQETSPVESFQYIRYRELSHWAGLICFIIFALRIFTAS